MSEDKLSVLELAAELRGAIDWREIRASAVYLLEAGHSQGDVVRELTERLDRALDFQEVIEGLPGAMVEELDRAVFGVAIGTIVRALNGPRYRQRYMARRTVGVIRTVEKIGGLT